MGPKGLPGSSGLPGFPGERGLSGLPVSCIHNKTSKMQIYY